MIFLLRDFFIDYGKRHRVEATRHKLITDSIQKPKERASCWSR